MWQRPHALGYHETLRGLGGIVAPLLAGFSLAAIATLATAEHPPPLAGWAVAALAAAVGLLLFSMQVAFLALTQNSFPDDILRWRPEATVSEEELQHARACQAADFEEMTRLGQKSLQTYGWGLIAFLVGVLFILIPDDWSAPWVIAVAITAAALLLEVWWLVSNRWRSLPHPIARRMHLSHRVAWDGQPPELDAVALAAVIDPARRDAAGLPPLVPRP